MVEEPTRPWFQNCWCLKKTTATVSTRIAHTSRMHPNIHMSSFVMYEIGGVIERREEYIEARVSKVVMLRATRPEKLF